MLDKNNNFTFIEKFDFYVVYKQEGKDWMFKQWFRAPEKAEQYITADIFEKYRNLFDYNIIMNNDRLVSIYDRKNELITKYQIVVYHAKL